MTSKDVVEYYRGCGSVRTTAKHFCVSYQTIRRVLISSGVLLDGRSSEIGTMIDQGYSIESIAAQLGLTVKSVKGYIPYSKGGYSADGKSHNALRIQACRDRKKVSKNAD